MVRIIAMIASMVSMTAWVLSWAYVCLVAMLFVADNINTLPLLVSCSILVLVLISAIAMIHMIISFGRAGQKRWFGA